MIPKTIKVIILDALADGPKSLTQLEIVLAAHDYEPSSANWAVWLLCRSKRILQLQRACRGTPSQYALGNPPPVAVRPPSQSDIAAGLGITPQTLTRGLRRGYVTLDPPTYTPAPRGRPSPDPTSHRAILRHKWYENRKERARIAAGARLLAVVEGR